MKRIASDWVRLDNASILFASALGRRDPKVFRFTYELTEDVQPELLQLASEAVLTHFPSFRSVLRRGIFWHYLERSDLKPIVEAETMPVCAPIYIKNRRNLLFRVNYHYRRINIEILHVLTDGTDAFWFTRRLIYEYLLLAHPELVEETTLALPDQPSIQEKSSEAFQHYAERVQVDPIASSDQGDDEPARPKKRRVFRVTGRRADDYVPRYLEGTMSAKAVLALAHEHKTTLTVFLTALFIYAIGLEMPMRHHRKRIILSVPINLRQFFPSETARNFFLTMNIGTSPDDVNFELDDLIREVDRIFQRELQYIKIKSKMDKLAAFERHGFLRLLPLPLKDLILLIAERIVGRQTTAVLSNLGRLDFAPAAEPFIRHISVGNSTRIPRLCICTCGDRLSLTMTTPFTESDIERHLFRYLSERGVEIELAANK